MPIPPQQTSPHIAANPSAIPAPHSGTSRTNLNIPEQIRTTPNTAKRPDQIGPPPDRPRTPRKKQNLNTVPAHLKGRRCDEEQDRVRQHTNRLPHLSTQCLPAVDVGAAAFADGGAVGGGV